MDPDHAELQGQISSSPVIALTGNGSPLTETADQSAVTMMHGSALLVPQMPVKLTHVRRHVHRHHVRMSHHPLLHDAEALPCSQGGFTG